MGLVQFQIAPHSSLHFSISIGPLRCSQCYLQGFYSVALVPSEAVPFVYLASVCQSLQCLISALTQAGGGGLLFRLLVPSGFGEGPALLSPSTLLRLPVLYMERALRCARFQPSGVPQKRAWVLCLPRRSGSGSQELDGRTLPSAVPVSVSARASRVRAPSHLRVPSPSPSPRRRSGACALCRRDPPGGCRPSRISGSL